MIKNNNIKNPAQDMLEVVNILLYYINMLLKEKLAVS